VISRKNDKEPEICIVCAWRADCQKKLSLAHGQKCLEFSRDLSLKPRAEGEEKGPAEK
jgi:hypothetical protein